VALSFPADPHTLAGMGVLSEMTFSPALKNIFYAPGTKFMFVITNIKIYLMTSLGRIESWFWVFPIYQAAKKQSRSMN
jgi:hypothetical protein